MGCLFLSQYDSFRTYLPKVYVTGFIYICLKRSIFDYIAKETKGKFLNWLVCRIGGRQMPIAYWRWRLRDNSSGVGLIELGWYLVE